MSNRLTQIALDFGPEHEAPSPPPGGGAGSGSLPIGQYIAAAGVVVRVKAYKNVPAPLPDRDALPPLPDKAVVLPLLPPAVVDVAIELSPVETGSLPIQLPRVVNGELFAVEVENGPEQAEALQPEAEEAPAVAAAAEVVAEEELPVAEAEPAVPRTERRRTAAGSRPAAPKTPSKRGRKSLKQVAAEADLIEIPGDEVLFSKQYYTMGEVSEMFRVNQSLLRYWETEFDILQPRKNKKGDRYFRPVDIKNLHLIYHLLRQRKYTIEGAKEFLKKNKKADERFEVIQRLQEIRAFLLEWKAQL